MGNLVLPQSNKNARDVYEVTGAILESIPGANVIKKFVDIHLNRKLEEQLNLLAAQVQESGIEILSEEQFEFYIPSAYRFAEQVRLGDYEHNLKILRKILIGQLKANSSDTGKIGRHARQMEYLSEFEIDVLVASYELMTHLTKSLEVEQFITSTRVRNEILRFNDVNFNSIQFGLSVLSSRGLLIARGEVVWDQAETAYDLSPDGLSIIQSAH
jgi:hypothetical protein